MTLLKLFSQLIKLSVDLTVKEGSLHISAPKNSLSEDVLAAIKENKKEIIRLIESKSDQKIQKIIKPRKEQQYFPMSFAQNRMWYFDRYLKESSTIKNINTVYSAIELNLELDSQAFKKSIERIVDEQQILRTYFVEKNGEVSQKILSTNEALKNLPIDEIHLIKSDLQKQKEIIKQNTQAIQQRSFSLELWPLFNIKVIKKSNKTILLTSMHHIITDAWSMGVFVNIISEYYDAFLDNKAIKNTNNSIQYFDYAKWQRDVVNSKQFIIYELFWKNYLKSYQNIDLIGDDINNEKKYAGKHYFHKIKKTKAISGLCKKTGITENVLFLSMYAILLYRLSEQNDFNIGIAESNRNNRACEDLVGFFTNTLVLRVFINVEDSFIQHIKNIGKSHNKIIDQAMMPFDHLTTLLNCDRERNIHPLFQVMYSYLEQKESKQTFLSARYKQLELEAKGSRFDLCFNVIEKDDAYLIDLEYRSHYFKEQSIQAYVGYIENFINYAATQGENKIANFTGMSEKALFQYYDGLSSEAEIDEKNISERFNKVVKHYGNKVAIKEGKHRLTYKQLDQLSNTLADKIISIQCKEKKTTYVAISFDRSCEYIIAALAVLKAGLAYVPVDYAYPVKHQQSLLDRLNTKLVITSKNNDVKLKGNIKKIYFDKETSIPKRKIKNRKVKSKKKIAAVFFTSGTTGQAKAVKISHKGILRLVDHTSFHHLKASDTVAFISNTNFDASLFDIWLPLLNGGCTALASKKEVLESKALEHYLQTNKVTHMMMMTALFNNHALSYPQAFSSLNTLYVGGEKFNCLAGEEFINQCPRVNFYNVYGPTENGCLSSYYKIEKKDINNNNMPIGRAIKNTKIYICDENNHIIPPHLPGELVVAGKGLSLGYIDEGDKSKAFITLQKPQRQKKNKMIAAYKTGDKARLNHNHQIEIISRLDDQLKVRGFRVDPIEIRQKLEKYKYIKQAYIDANSNDYKEVSLTAYLLLDGAKLLKEQEIIESIRAYVENSLPRYLHPDYYQVVDEMPLNANDKIDRRKLRAIKRKVKTNKKNEKLTSLKAKKIKDIFKEVLNNENINEDDDFFQQGGHSLMAVRLCSKLESELGLKLELRHIFENPSVTLLYRFITKNPQFQNQKSIVIKSYPRKEISINDQKKYLVKASYFQKRLWYLYQLERKSLAYNIPILLKLSHNKNEIDKERLKYCLIQLLKNHEVLRTNITIVEDEIVQVINKNVDVDQYIELIKHNKENSNFTSIISLAKTYATHCFYLEKSPLFRAKIIEHKDECYLFIHLHHIISDEASINIIKSELITLYENNSNAGKQKTSLQYADFSEWQYESLNQDYLQKEKNFWMHNLADVQDRLHLPIKVMKTVGETKLEKKVECSIEGKDFERVSEQISTLEINNFMLILAAYQIVIAKYSGQSNFVLGVPVDLRQHSAFENTLGFFINALMIRSEFNERLNIKEFINNVKNNYFEVLEHKDIPVDLIVKEWFKNKNREKNQDERPLVQLGYSYINKNITREPSDISIENLTIGDQIAKYELVLAVTEESDKLLLSIVYQQSRYRENDIKRLLKHILAVTHQLCRSDMQKQLREFKLYESKELLESYVDNKANIKQGDKLYSLSNNQKLMLMDEELSGVSKQGAIGYTAEVKSKCDVEIFKKALLHLIKTEEIMRAKLVKIDAIAADNYYWLVNKNKKVELNIEDWSRLALNNNEINFRLSNIIYKNYRLTKDDLTKHHLIKLNENHYYFILATHHILMDGACANNHLSRVIDYYHLYKRKQKPSHNIKTMMFAKELEDERSYQYWQKRLSKLEAPVLRVVNDSANDKSLQFCHKIQYQNKKNIQAFCRENIITESIFFKAIYGLLISYYSKSQGDFLVFQFEDGRNNQNREHLALYYQEQAFIYRSKALFSTLKEYLNALKNEQRANKSYKNISSLSLRALAPFKKIGFMFNIYKDIDKRLFEDKEIKSNLYSPNIKKYVQLHVRMTKDAYELRLFYQENILDGKVFINRFIHLIDQLCCCQANDQLNKLHYLTNQEEQCLKVLRANNPKKIKAFHCYIQACFDYYQQNLKKIVFSKKGENLTGGNFLSSVTKTQQLIDLKITDNNKQQSVILFLPIGLEHIVGIYALLSKRISYIPLDINSPNKRLQSIIKQSRAGLVLTNDFGEEKLALIKIKNIEIINIEKIISEKSSAKPTNNNKDEMPIITKGDDDKDDIYTLFTSGSTGQAKGALIKYQGQANLLHWYQNAFNITHNDRCLIISSPAFDLTQKNFFIFPAVGASITGVHDKYYDEDVILNCIDENKITFINCAPSAFYPLIEDKSRWHKLKSLKKVCLGGEAIEFERIENWARQKQTAVFNSYGPTECSDVVAFHEIDFKKNHLQTPIGLPITGVDLFIVDHKLRRLAPGMQGELCIGGKALGRGYLNNKALDKKSFVSIDLQGIKQRVYRSGDIVYQNEDGLIEFVGRNDDQIKINGMRIELKEIEDAIHRIKSVKSVKAVVDKACLIAFVISNAKIQKEKIKKWNYSWREQLLEYLPQAYLPSEIYQVSTWPLNSNAKVDKKALIKSISVFNKHANKRTKVLDATEAVLLSFWREILQVDSISMTDGFFDLGGHSIAISQLANRIRNHFSLDIAIKKLFEVQTIEAQAKLINNTILVAKLNKIKEKGEEGVI